jgi:lipid kinase, YegS/Rv2252/BmrU family
MHNNGGLKLLFVINPVSGGKEKNDWEATIRNYFRESIHSIEFYIIQKNHDKTSIQHYVDTLKPDRVIAVGGDGTVKLVAEILKGKEAILGILPAGSANGMAKELNIPEEIEKALPIAIESTGKNIDLLQVNDDQICIHLSDIGLNALLLKYFEKSKIRGMIGYSLALFKVLGGKQKFEATIKTDKETVKRKAFMIVIANAGSYGTGAVINPESNLYDGKFEVVVIRQLHLYELFKMLITHKPFDPDCVEIFPATSLEITTVRKAYFQVDGEFLGKISSIKVKMLHHALRVAIPDEAKNDK